LRSRLKIAVDYSRKSTVVYMYYSEELYARAVVFS
jgi:hypothetical protein